jgi:hypothetical protein
MILELPESQDLFVQSGGLVPQKNNKTPRSTRHEDITNWPNSQAFAYKKTIYTRVFRVFNTRNDQRD